VPACVNIGTNYSDYPKFTKFNGFLCAIFGTHVTLSAIFMLNTAQTDPGTAGQVKPFQMLDLS